MNIDGPGKYDDLCTHVREESDGDLVVVLILRGNRGTGFSVQARSQDELAKLPGALEDMALRIRQQIMM